MRLGRIAGEDLGVELAGHSKAALGGEIQVSKGENGVQRGLPYATLL